MSYNPKCPCDVYERYSNGELGRREAEQSLYSLGADKVVLTLNLDTLDRERRLHEGLWILRQLKLKG